METHSEDPIDPTSVDPWERLSDQFSALRKRLADTYRQQAGPEGPSEGEVKDAFSTLGKAWDRLADAVGAAARDQQIRHNVKQAATTFFEAVGSAFSELGAELRRTVPHQDKKTGPEDQSRLESTPREAPPAE
ncbi:MAG: hypothetical protein ACT4OP_07910 [Actinomycetota bacterium]